MTKGFWVNKKNTQDAFQGFSDEEHPDRTFYTNDDYLTIIAGYIFCEKYNTYISKCPKKCFYKDECTRVDKS